MTLPRISLIITTFQRPQWVGRAVQSALAAWDGAPEALEVIVVDDASPDETALVVSDLAAQNAQVKAVLLQENVGLAGARNAGLQEASGEFVTFLDDDDARLPGSLRPQMEALQAHPGAAFVYSRADECADIALSRSGQVFPAQDFPLVEGDLFWALMRDNFMVVPSVFARRQNVEKAGLFDARLRRCEDWDLWVRLAHDAPVAALDVSVAAFRAPAFDTDQLSAREIPMAQTAWECFQRWGHLPRAQNEPENLKNATTAFLNRRHDRLMWEARRLWARGKRGAALEDFRAAIKLHPSRALRPRTFLFLLGR